MNINNLQENMIIKNYKELCNLLEIKPTGGDSKKAQLKELGTHINYEKQGYKFIIKEIYDKQKVKEDGRVGGYSEMRTLILRLLDMSNQNNNIVLPTSVLLRKLSMVNDNYAIARRSQKELSELLDMKQEYIADFYSSTHKNLKRALETNLNKLQRERLIFWSNTVMVCKNKVGDIKKNELGEFELDENGNLVCDIKQEFRVATQQEKEIILNTEKKVLKEYGYTEIGDIYKHCKSEAFYKEVYKRVKKSCNINFYFLGYDITFIKENIEEELKKIDEDNFLGSKMNKVVKDRVKDNASKRVEKAKSKKVAFGRDKDPKVTLRASEQYIENMNILIDTVISLEAKRIKEELEVIKEGKKV